MVSVVRDDSFRLGEAEKRIAEIRARIREMGSVNVSAVDEYRETKTRHDELSAQRSDLTKAEASYNRVQNDFPGGDFADTATRRLAILKTKPPVEIEAPPTPAATATPGAAIQPNLISPPDLPTNPGSSTEDVPPVQFPTQDQTPPPGSDPQENPPAPEKP